MHGISEGAPPSRRAFLVSLLALSGATTVAASLPQAVLAANEPRRLLDHYVAGRLRQASSSGITLDILGIPGTTEVAIALTSGTQICRHRCDVDWTALKTGDRISAGTYLGGDGHRIGNWVVANGVVGRGIVTRVMKGPGMHQVSLASMRPGKDVERDIILTGVSRVYFADGRKAVGSAEGFEAGHIVFFTGTSDTADPYARQVSGLVVHQTGKS